MALRVVMESKVKVCTHVVSCDQQAIEIRYATNDDVMSLMNISLVVKIRIFHEKLCFEKNQSANDQYMK